MCTYLLLHIKQQPIIYFYYDGVTPHKFSTVKHFTAAIIQKEILQKEYR